MSSAHCLNCGKSLHDKYCAHCGQAANTHRLNWAHFIHEIPHSLFHLDKGFLFTAKELCLRPGKTVREFLDGKRIQHFRPLTYAILLGVIMSLGLFGYNAPDQIHAADIPADTDQMEIQIEGDTLNYLFSKYYGLIVILCVPFYALFAWMFYRKERNFIEIVTAFIFIYAHTTWFALLLVFARWLSNESIQEVVVYFWAALVLCYIIWGNTTLFTRYKPAGRFLRGILIFVFGFILAGIALLFGAFIFQQMHA